VTWQQAEGCGSTPYRLGTCFFFFFPSRLLDPELRIPSYCSAVETDVICDVAAGRAVWEHALQTRCVEFFFHFFHSFLSLLDPELRIPSYWFAVESDVFCDVAAGRAVGDTLCRPGMP